MDLYWPDNLMNLFEILELGGQPSVHADDLLINDGTDWHDVETVAEDLPEFQVVLALA